MWQHSFIQEIKKEPGASTQPEVFKPRQFTEEEIKQNTKAFLKYLKVVKNKKREPYTGPTW